MAIGYQPPQPTPTDSVANAITAQAAGSVWADSAPSVDELIATRVVAGIAERADLPIARNVANLSSSLSIESQLAQENTNVITKPQIIQPTAGNRAMRSYTAVAGDTVEKVAARFNISAETIKWANDMSSDAIEPGRKLDIPPVNGVIYTVKEGDTTASIAERYKADEQTIIAFNDLELSGLRAGRKLILPDANLPSAERPGYVAPQPAYNPSASGLNFANYGGGVGSANNLALTAGNRYAFGNCTWYAYERRVQLGLPVGSFWGNANTWASYASAAGLTVTGTPTAGAIMQNGGGYGHVAIVESVNPGVSIYISEMNGYRFNGGFNRIGRGEVSWAEATSGMYRYIQ